MISVNGVQLDNDLFIDGEYSEPARAWNVRQTMGPGGKTYIQETIAVTARLLVLTSMQVDGGYLGLWTKDQLDVIRQLEESGAVVTLTVESSSWQVKVVPGGISVDPIRPRPNAEGSDKSYGSVTFIRI